MNSRRSPIDFTSTRYIRDWFKRREGDTLAPEDRLSQEELIKLHNNIHFTRKHFPETLQNNINSGMPTEEDRKIITP